MKSFKRLLISVVRDSSGGEVLEYALVAGLIVIAAIATIASVGTKVLARWNAVNDSMQAALIPLNSPPDPTDEADMVLRALLEFLPLLILLAVAACIDLRCRRIPNWLTFGLILSGLARAAVLGGVWGVGNATAGLFAGALVPFILFALGALGGGDVKLLAAIGAWLGPQEALAVFAVQCVIGMVLVLIQAASQGRTIALFRNSALLVADITNQGVIAAAPGQGGTSFTSIDRPLPYAVPVGLATVAVLLAGVWVGQ